MLFLDQAAAAAAGNPPNAQRDADVRRCCGAMFEKNNGKSFAALTAQIRKVPAGKLVSSVNFP